MKNNKDNYNTRIIIATVLSTFLMVLWMKFYGGKTITQDVKRIDKEIKQEQLVENTEERIENKKIEIEEKELLSNENIIFEEKRLIIDTEKLKGSINLRGLLFDDLILENYKKEIDSNEKVQLLAQQNANNAYYLKFAWSSDNSNLDLPNTNTLWKSDSEKLTINNPVVLSYKSKDNITFQIIASIDQNYMFTFRQNVINNSNNAISLKIDNKIIRKNTLNTEMATAVHEGFIGSFNNRLEEEKYKKLENKRFNFNTGFSWAGFTDKYWLVSLATEKEKNNTFDVKTNYIDNNYIINFITNNIIISPNQSSEITNLLFAGPKILNLLDQYSFQYDLPLFDRTVDFGWFYFLTKPIYVILKTFYNFFGNFGVAILFLTFVVKCIMYPFTKKSYISMARMKETQPKIEALKKRYADDKMKMNKELIELYKKENISPLSGCLPMLVQIPVFFSLYKVLVISIDMRQAPFFGYIKNLAAKDPTTIWNLFGLLPFNVSFLHIGLLPCLMSLTMWIQQKMTTQVNSNPETQTVTKLMPIIFLLVFAGMPAGLLVYWIFSNIITIGQQYYIEKKTIKK